MTVAPPWVDTAALRRVEEPFRSDADFWAAMAASTDAFLALLAAAAVAAVLTSVFGGAFPLLVFVIPVPLFVRASHVSQASSGRTKQEFASHAAWRDAERRAVARSFRIALLRRRFTRI
jgi:fatty acid desaturase